MKLLVDNFFCYLFIDKNFQDNIENICDIHVLGQQSSEVFIASQSVAYLYLGATTNIKARCREYASDMTLQEGVSKIQLTKPTRCIFDSNDFSFYLQSNQKPLDIFEFKVSTCQKITIGGQTNNNLKLKKRRKLQSVQQKCIFKGQAHRKS